MKKANLDAAQAVATRMIDAVRSSRIAAQHEIDELDRQQQAVDILEVSKRHELRARQECREALIAEGYDETLVVMAQHAPAGNLKRSLKPIANLSHKLTTKARNRKAEKAARKARRVSR